MDAERFNTTILERRIAHIQDTLQRKSQEYGRTDRLHNFHVAARIMGITPEEALIGMAMKHIVSVLDIVDGEIPNTAETCDEKIGDLINYLILLEACLSESRCKF